MLLNLLLTSLFAFCAIRLFLLAKKIKRKYDFISKLPGPPAKPLIGNALDFGKDSFAVAEFLIRAANEERAKGNNIMRLWVGARPFVFPLNGEALKPILDSTVEIKKGADYDITLPWLGTGLLTSTGAKWKSRRRLLTPTFHFSMLDGYVEKMDRHGRVLVDVLEDNVGKEFDIYPFIKRCALDIICDTAMGTELDSQHDPSHPYARTVAEFNTIILDYSLSPSMWLPPVWYALYERDYKRKLDILLSFTKEVIESRMKAHAKGELNFEETGKRKAFLDMLIEMKEANSLTDEDIREEVDTFMFEGHDTTSSAMAWSLWALATNPHVQKKVHEEVDSVFGDSDRSITVEDLKSLPYLERAVKETLRIFPAVPMVQRNMIEDFQMGGYVIPKGADITIAPIVIHHNREVFPDDWVYDPDNFLPEKVAKRHAYDYIPFSAGLRNCIGQKFAMNEEKLILAWIMRRFSVHTDIDMLKNEMGPEVVLRPSLGVPITLRRRAL